MRRAADGTGDPEFLVESASAHLLNYPNWSRDGRFVLYNELSPETLRDIRYIELRADGAVGEPVMFLGTPVREELPNLSPDGRFLAYASDESERYEVYVRSFPGGDGKWQASVNGGTLPRWRSDGRELYYVEGDTLMAVSVSTEPTFALGQPQPLFESPDPNPADALRQYDVSADGQRFLTIALAEADGDEISRPTIRVVENWYEEFRDREQ